jgi:hypothetical protein
VLLAAPLSGAVFSRIIGIKRTIVLGLAISFAGMLYVRHLIGVDASAAHLIPGLIINGFGFGMAISNLANITLSAASLAEAGEASGINNTARQLGATLGTAVLGAIMISTIQTNLTSSIKSSAVIPSLAKPAIAAGVSRDVQTLGETTPGEGQASLPHPVVAEIQDLSKQAMVDGVRKGLAYGAAILAGGFLLSLRLPSGAAAHGPAPASAQAAGETSTPPANVPEPAVASTAPATRKSRAKKPVRL